MIEQSESNDPETVMHSKPDPVKQEPSAHSSVKKSTDTSTAAVAAQAIIQQQLRFKEEVGDLDDDYGDEPDEDFDMEDMEMLGQEGQQTVAKLFDDDAEDEDAQARLQSRATTAAMFKANMPGFEDEDMEDDEEFEQAKKNGENTMECKDESLDDMLNEQRELLEQDGTIKKKRVLAPQNRQQHQLPFSAFLPGHQN